MHGVLNSLFDGRLIFPPIRSPRRVLDCGCGPGDWAMEVATQYPDSEVCFSWISSERCLWYTVVISRLEHKTPGVVSAVASK